MSTRKTAKNTFSQQGYKKYIFLILGYLCNKGEEIMLCFISAFPCFLHIKSSQVHTTPLGHVIIVWVQEVLVH